MGVGGCLCACFRAGPGEGSERTQARLAQLTCLKLTEWTGFGECVERPEKQIENKIITGKVQENPQY